MIKQVIVMRTDLGMRKGKMIAQGAHAAMVFLCRYLSNDETSLTEEQITWLGGSFTKICVGIGSESELLELIEKAKDAGLTVYPMIDNGTTEFGGIKTLTCAAFGPHEADKLEPFTGALKLL